MGEGIQKDRGPSKVIKNVIMFGALILAVAISIALSAAPIVAAGLILVSLFKGC